MATLSPLALCRAAKYGHGIPRRLQRRTAGPRCAATSHMDTCDAAARPGAIGLRGSLSAARVAQRHEGRTLPAGAYEITSII